MGIEQPQESPIIKLDANREAIVNKLQEYKSRLNPGIAPEMQFDTLYKIAVAEKLVETGEVNTHDLSRELNNKYGHLDVGLFDNACGVIEDYISTGGKHTIGGTGLHGKGHSADTITEDGASGINL